MGTPKQVVIFGDRPLLTVAVEQALQVCSRCIVVTGANREQARAAIPSRPEVEEVHNPHYEDGMISSIALGARLVRSPWFFVAPGDMPRLSPEIFAVLSQAARDDDPDRGPASFFPVYAGRRGHPVLISGRVIPELQSRVRDYRSMREFLCRYESKEITVSDAGIAVDIDTPEDLALAEDTGGKRNEQYEAE